MDIQKGIIDTIGFAKKFILTFFLSVCQPHQFFITNRFRAIRVNHLVYLYLSIFLYLILYTVQNSIFRDASETISRIEIYLNKMTFFQEVIYTIPIFLYSILLIWLASLPMKRQAWLNQKHFAYTLYANTILFEVLIKFVLAIFFHTANLAFNGAGTIVSNSWIGRLVIDEGIDLLALLLPLTTLIVLKIKYWSLSVMRVSIFFFLCCFASNIVFNFNYYLIKTLAKKNADLRIIDPSIVGDDLINLNCKVTSDTTCIIYGSFIFINKTDRTLIFDKVNLPIDFTVDSLSNDGIRIDSDLLKSFENFLRLVTPDSVSVSKYVGDYIPIVPDETFLVTYYKKQSYSVSNVELFHQFRFPSNLNLCFNLYVKVFDDEGSSIPYRSHRGILNFDQDKGSINLYPRAVRTYLYAQDALIAKGIPFQR